MLLDLLLLSLDLSISFSCCPGGVGGAGACGHRKVVGGSEREAREAREARETALPATEALLGQNKVNKVQQGDEEIDDVLSRFSCNARQILKIYRRSREIKPDQLIGSHP